MPEAQEIVKFFQDLFLDLWDNFQEVFLQIIIMVIVMILGFIVSWLVKKLLGKILLLFRFDKWAEEAGIAKFLGKGGIHTAPSLIFSKIVYWIFIVLFLSFGLNYVGLSQFSEYASRISSTLPNIIVSIVIVILGIIFSNFIGKIIYLACEGGRVRYGDFIARGVKILLIVITFGIAFEYLGIGNTIVTISFLIVFGGVILTLSLALGIGLSNVVGDVIRERVKLMGDEKKDPHHMSDSEDTP
jgi:hypothetical protein